MKEITYTPDPQALFDAETRLAVASEALTAYEAQIGYVEVRPTSGKLDFAALRQMTPKSDIVHEFLRSAVKEAEMRLYAVQNGLPARHYKYGI